MVHKSIILARKPAIEVYCFIEKGLIQQTRLEISQEGFKCHLITDGSAIDLESKLEEWLHGYANKNPPQMHWPFNRKQIPIFTLNILNFIHSIPFGSSFSYGEIAQKVGRPHAYRAVGGACGRNPFPLLIPCHRVLAANHLLGGFTGGIEIKQGLLAFENILC